jgi:hypothetical protein
MRFVTTCEERDASAQQMLVTLDFVSSTLESLKSLLYVMYGIVIVQILAQFFEAQVSFGHGTFEGRIDCL